MAFKDNPTLSAKGTSGRFRSVTVALIMTMPLVAFTAPSPVAGQEKARIRHFILLKQCIITIGISRQKHTPGWKNILKGKEFSSIENL